MYKMIFSIIILCRIFFGIELNSETKVSDEKYFKVEGLSSLNPERLYYQGDKFYLLSNSYSIETNYPSANVICFNADFETEWKYIVNIDKPTRGYNLLFEENTISIIGAYDPFAVTPAHSFLFYTFMNNTINYFGEFIDRKFTSYESNADSYFTGALLAENYFSDEHYLVSYIVNWDTLFVHNFNGNTDFVKKIDTEFSPIYSGTKDFIVDPKQNFVKLTALDVHGFVVFYYEKSLIEICDSQGSLIRSKEFSEEGMYVELERIISADNGYIVTGRKCRFDDEENMLDRFLYVAKLDENLNITAETELQLELYHANSTIGHRVKYDTETKNIFFYGKTIMNEWNNFEDLSDKSNFILLQMGDNLELKNYTIWGNDENSSEILDICKVSSNTYAAVGLINAYDEDNRALYISNIEFTPTDVATSELKDNEILLFPNPVKHNLLLNIDAEAIGNAAYRILDVGGRVYSRGYVKNNAISVEFLPKGCYILMIEYKDKVRTQRFVKL